MAVFGKRRELLGARLPHGSLVGK